MAESNDILELKFHGNGIGPDTVKPHEIAELIISFEKSLLYTIKQEHPEIDTQHLLFSFHRVDDKSLDIIFKTLKVKEVVFGSYSLIASAITTSNYNKLNSDTIESLREITRFTKKYDCLGQFKHNDQSIATFNKHTEVVFDKSNELKGETRIYGVVVRVGGESPTVHFRVDNDYKIVIDVKEEIAKRLASKLYEQVGLIGTATWDYKSYKVIGFKVSVIVEIDEKPVKESFKELRKLIGKYWDGIDDITTVLG